MIYDGIEYHPVTDDLATLALLVQKEGEVGSAELGKFAASLGLRPPGHDEGSPIPAIVAVFPPNIEDGVLVWDDFDDEDHGEEDSATAASQVHHLSEHSNPRDPPGQVRGSPSEVLRIARSRCCCCTWWRHARWRMPPTAHPW